MRLPFDHLMDQPMLAPLMKSLNGIGLLNLIREQGPISRAELAKLSALSKPTVSSQVENLIRKNLVVERGPGKSGHRGGKKPTLIEFNGDFGRLVAVEVDASGIRIVLTDLEGKVIDRATVATKPETGSGQVLRRLVRGIEKLLNAPGRREKLRVIGVAAPGRVDAERGIVLEAGNLFSWRNVLLRQRLQKSFGVPVFVDNDVNMAALGEMAHGMAQSVSNFVLVRLDTGIGSGVVIGGKLHHGVNWAAGEIAHFVLDPAEAGKDWRARGYLESYVGADRIAERVRVATRTSRGKLSRLVKNKGAFPALLEAFQQGDAEADRILREVTTRIALAVAHLSAAYDPSLVVLQGALLELLFEEIRQTVARVIPWQQNIALSTLGEEAVLQGTVVAARQHVYELIARTLDRRGDERVAGFIEA